MTLEELNKKLKPCYCGGEVSLIQLGYPYDTYEIRCKKCNGVWHQNYYSVYDVAENWGIIKDISDINGDKIKILFCLDEAHIVEPNN